MNIINNHNLSDISRLMTQVVREFFASGFNHVESCDKKLTSNISGNVKEVETHTVNLFHI